MVLTRLYYINTDKKHTLENSMRKANTREARNVIKAVCGDKLMTGVGSTWTDTVNGLKAYETAERRVGMALRVWGEGVAERLERELNFWMKASGYTNKVTVCDSELGAFYKKGLLYVRFKAEKA